MPAQGVAFGSSGTSTGRMASGVAQRPPSASGSLRGRPGPGIDPRYGGVPGRGPAGSIAPRARPTVRGPIVAPILALAGLIAIGGASVWGISLVGAVGAGAEASPTPLFAVVPGASPGSDGLVEESFVPEPEMSLNPVLVTPPPDQRATVRGTIVFARGGEIHAASGQEIERLTSGQFDTSPTWSPNGKHIYFIRTRVRSTNKTRENGKYTFYIPVLTRMQADGQKKKPIYDGLINGPNGLWFSHLLQPDVSPNGRTIAVVSDGPDGNGPVVLHTLSSTGGRLRGTGARTIGDLGDNDPAWSPNGQQIAFTHNRRQGDDGVPALTLHNVRSGKTKTLKSGYAHASWSPDGNWIAAELTTGTGRDIVILDARRGDELARLTTDGDSFAPVVSPDGDQVAYLHRDGLAIDLRLATLSIDDQRRITLVDDRAVTDDGAIDAGSSPSWFIPEDERVPDADEELVDPGALQASAAD